ncbi:MAG: phenylacetate--CoA ligase family protein [Holophagaceae bacterium]|uniref:Phenylacetate--CoA ligase family protein n=1 Tax=Candidatus Geothrix skivensis TaxID=2954439 RepID=A0A9D7SJ29_9BACT|nr:phenylacetate--CoA ligase family protein [Candidatus Geothrix skivensis]
MLSARVRNWGFWARDLLQGSPIRKHCEDIEARLASGTPSADLLQGLLDYAVESTAFYGDYRAFKSLQDFPVINKAILKAQYDAFRSTGFSGVRLHTLHTSGSTGTPFAILQDPDKRRRVLAEMICFGRRAGYRVGDRFVFTRVWNEHNRKSRLAAFSENAVMFDISHLDEARMASLGELLHRDRNIRCLLGYPSTFGPLVRHLEDRGDGPEAFSLRSIISISEWLPPQTREALRARFGCPVVSRYSNQENGVLAQQCADGDEFHLNTASYVFEFLKLDEDLPANPGERARMVVTDLYNRAMPMIRYDTGDVVIRQSSPSCGWRTETLSEVEGRRLDFIYDTQDRLLSPVVVCNHFWPFTRLKQFQFVQEAKGRYRIILNGALGQYEDAIFVELVKGFLGADASVSVVHVDQIPQLASGKFMVVVSHYRPAP